MLQVIDEKQTTVYKRALDMVYSLKMKVSFFCNIHGHRCMLDSAGLSAFSVCVLQAMQIKDMLYACCIL